MGWCSGTDIFDRMAKKILESDLPEAAQYSLLYELIDALEDSDWDCQDDSAYSKHPLVDRALRSLHPHWYED